jgi:hypothetical protein
VTVTEYAVSEEAQELHAQGRAAGGDGDSARAIELLQRAHLLAPTWPYPPYDLAFTHLLADDLDRAEQWYTLVDRLAPRGFFTAKTALDTIGREKRGELFVGFSKQYALLESEPDDEEKRKALGYITSQFPAFAPAWQKLSNLLDGDKEKLRAIERGLAGNPDDETYGVLTVNKALITRRNGNRAGAKLALEELLVDPRCTASVEALSRLTLSDL